MATSFYSRVSYIGDGSTKTFSFNFPYFAKNHIKVTIDGVETNDYTFLSESSIEFTSAPAQDSIVTIYRETPKDRIIDFQNGSILNADTLDNDSNQMMFLVQEANDNLGNLIDLDLDNKWDADGKIIKNVGDPVEGTDYLNYGTALTIVSDSEAARDAAQLSETNAATSETNAATSETNALASEQAAATSETNALASEQAAATSETNALASEQAAATSETNALASANNAATSETNAATSETNALASEQAAATSETNAAESEANAMLYGKKIYVQSTEPTNPEEGSIWFKVVN
jgi:hypothetical protein